MQVVTEPLHLCTQFVAAGLCVNWVGLGWVGLGWVGLGWVGLGWVGDVGFGSGAVAHR